MFNSATFDRSVPQISSTALFQSQQLREIEIAAKKILPVGALMRAAGLAASRLAKHLLPNARGRALVLAGAGDNGGDALEVAYLLATEGIEVNLLWLGKEDQHSAEARQSLQRAQHSAAIWLSQEQVESMPLSHWNLIIDGLFGIGLNRAIDGEIATLIFHLNQQTKIHAVPVLALDIPSGLLSDTGQAFDEQRCVLRADYTISFIGNKIGLHTAMGKDYAGEIHIDHLGIELRSFPRPHAHLLVEKSFRHSLSKRQHDSHKGTFGDVLIVGGSAGMAGAPLLAGRAALYCGAGRVHLGYVGDAPMFDPVHPELMCRMAQDSDFIHAVVVIGPGLGTSEEAKMLLQRALQEAQALVLDADALNLLAMHEDLRALVSLRSPQKLKTILTPHPLEAARLLKSNAKIIQADRCHTAQQLAQTMQACVILKGAGSIIANHNQLWINSSGNPSLATAGTGDVLSGVCGALLAQGLNPEHAACLAVYLHGKAADDIVADGTGPIGLSASEFIPAIRQALNRI